MGIALVGPVGSDGHNRSALWRGLVLSGVAAAALAAPVLASVRDQTPSATLVIAEGSLESEGDVLEPQPTRALVGLGPLFHRGGVAPTEHSSGEMALGFDARGSAKAGGSGEGVAPSSSSTSGPAGRPAGAATGGCRESCASTDADAGPGPTSSSAHQPADAPSPITVVYTTTTTTTTTTRGSGGAAAGSTTSTSPGSTATTSTPTTSATTGSRDPVTSTSPSTSTTSTTTSSPTVQTETLPPVDPGDLDGVEYRLEFTGGLLWLRVTSSGLTLLDVVAKDPFGVDAVESDPTTVRVRLKSSSSRQDITAEFRSDGRTTVTSTTRLD